LFWKKKTKTPPSNNDDLFEFEIEDERGDYRIEPPKEDPIIMQTNNGKNISVHDISAGGVSFYNKKLIVGNRFKLSLAIPDNKENLPVEMQVVFVKDNLVCCQFLKPSSQLEEAVHHYVLNAQKESLRQNRTH